jgi:GTP cyclohydrolase I
MYQELLSGYQEDPIQMVNDAVFEVTYDEMVIVRDIEFYSLCETHAALHGKGSRGLLTTVLWDYPRSSG